MVLNSRYGRSSSSSKKRWSHLPFPPPRWELLDDDTLFLPDDVDLSQAAGRIMLARGYFQKNAKANGVVPAPGNASPTGSQSLGGSGGFDPNRGDSKGSNNSSISPQEKDFVRKDGTQKASVQPKSAFQFSNRAAKEAKEKEGRVVAEVVVTWSVQFQGCFVGMLVGFLQGCCV